MKESTARVGWRVLFGFFAVMVGLSMACNSLTPNGTNSGSEASDESSTEDEAAAQTSQSDLVPEVSADGRPVGWSAETHSNDVAADYAVVFPEAKVNRLDITIASEDWQAMQDNMVELYGQPGEGNQTAGGAGQEPFLPGGGDLGTDGRFPGGAGAMPEELTEACAELQEGDDCTASVGGFAVTGTCTLSEDDALVCIPEMDFDQPQDGAMPDGGVPGGGMGGMGFGGGANPMYVPCTVEFEGNTWWYVGVRYKGQSSLTSTWSAGVGKLPLRFDFDEFEDDHPEVDDQRFYGFKELSLASNWSDSSYLREKVAHDIFREAGVPAPRTAFYRVYIDFGEGATYFGLYTMTEVPDDPMLLDQFGNDDGNLYKPTSNWVTFDEDGFDKETNQDDEDWSDVEAAIDALHADRSDGEAWRAGLEAVFDVDGFLRWLAVNTVIQNWDTYGNMAQNYYLYGNPDDDGRLHWIPWDNNMALMDGTGGTTGADSPGGDRGFGGMGRTLSLSLDEVDDSWPLIRYLADDPVYWAAYVEYVQETVQDAFAVDATQERYQAAHDLIAPYVVGDEGELSDYTLLSGSEEFEAGLAYLLDHVVERNQAVQEFLETIP